MLLAVGNRHLAGQQMTSQAPPAGAGGMALPDEPGQAAGQAVSQAAQAGYPVAHAVVGAPGPDEVHLESKVQTYQGGVYTLDREVVVTSKDRQARADHIEYDSNTGDLTMVGHVEVTGGQNQERISASHGTYNIRTGTGRFFDVSGSVGIKSTPQQRKTVYTTDSPFLFTGRVVIKTGPEVYDVYDGTVTSCELPKPDWILSAAHISLTEDTASAHDSVFHLLNFPLLFLPYVTHPANADARQSGILIPTVGESSTKGFIIGEQVYLVLDRSSDLTVGAEYYSSIGFAQNATYRYKGVGYDFLKVHYSGVLDRRLPANNQGGEEAVLAARHDFDSQTRVATNVDYLSSYIYREAFSDSYNQAVTSDIVSTIYLTHEWDGVEVAGLGDRYQGIKVVEPTQEEVHIFHAPTISLDSTDHRVPGTGNAFSNGLEVSLGLSGSGLKRTQPNFETPGIVERFDLHPQANYPIDIDGWHIVPSLAARETYYTRSRERGLAPGVAPEASVDSTSRADVEFGLEIRPPVIERTFEPTHLTRILGTEVRHTIEPEITYRLADGVDNFRDILRFDPVDVVSNTDELEYGVTQRLFRRPMKQAKTDPSKPCDTQAIALDPGFSSAAPNDADDAPMPGATGDDPGERVNGQCPSEELISWRLTQKYFFDQTFGGAVVNGRRNIFTTTLDLSGVAFLTEPREISPLISRLRFRSSAHTDVEWDFDYDTGAKKFNSNNVYLDVHQGNTFGALSYARLNAPGRFFTENPTPTPGVASTDGVTSQVSDFNQLRVLLGYGNPVKQGLSIAGNAGIDLKAIYGATQQQTNAIGVTSTNTVPVPLLQYATVQASYNWNCCGLAVEYRKFELGSVRNEGTYRFNFTLANIGAAGNLRRAERLF
jgi:LPS-assembly protein